MYLEVMPSGAKYWRLKYRIDGKEKRAALGVYPKVSLLNENGFNSDWIERQLAHTEQNSVRAAYNHAQYLPERRRMMQWWGDYLDRTSRKDCNL